MKTRSHRERDLVFKDEISFGKGRTIRKVKGGGWEGKKQKKSKQRGKKLKKSTYNRVVGKKNPYTCTFPVTPL